MKAEEAKQTASETADLAGQKAKETKHSAAQTADIAGQKTNQVSYFFIIGFSADRVTYSRSYSGRRGCESRKGGLRA